MFTGLIQSMGRVSRSSKGLFVEGCGPFSPLNLGDSIAVDGVCLTVAELISDGFLADVSEETLSRTTLGEKAERRDLVNLEPALRLSDRLGGHLVSGHIDGLGEVVALEKMLQSWKLEILLKNHGLGRYICTKGSISLNGISLTVAGFSDNGIRFWITVIPHTWMSTTLKNLDLGSMVNIEVDLLAKYSERLLVSREEPKVNSSEEISKSWLKNHGWI